MGEKRDKLTVLINSWFRGDRSVEEELWAELERELKKIAASKLRSFRQNHTLSPSDLLNELYLKLQRRDDLYFPSRERFFALASKAVSFILVDYEKRHRRRPEGQTRATLDTAIVLERGLDPLSAVLVQDLLNQLASFAPRAELIVRYRVYGGLGPEQISRLEGWSISTIAREWRTAKSWIMAQYAERKRDGRS